MDIENYKEVLRQKIFTPTDKDIKTFSLGFALFQANVQRFLPNFSNDNLEKTYKQLLFNQYLASLDQFDTDKLEKITVKNASDKIDISANKPLIFATFHYGSYKAVNYYLLKKGYNVVLIVDEPAYKNHKDNIDKSYTAFKQQINNGADYIVLNIKDTASIFKVKNLMQKGYVLLVYMDGNVGVQKERNLEKGSLEIQFCSSNLFVKKGVAFLSALLSVPIIPVISSWDEKENILLEFYDTVMPDESNDKNVYIQATIQKLYSILAENVMLQMNQWEAWSYMHKWIKRDIMFPYEETNNLQLIFNKHRYFLFLLNDGYYVFDKYSYCAFPLDKETYFHLQKGNVKKIKSKKLEYLSSKNIIL
jgi:lauroyl/myristoyl acyltransferase